MTMFNWEKTLHLVRGFPGEGKSTLALQLVGGDHRRKVENDDYWLGGQEPMSYTAAFLKVNYPREWADTIEKAEYSYKLEMTHLAANWCGAEAFRRLRMFHSVAVANVFARREHIYGYLEEARKLGVRVLLHRPKTNWVGNVAECLKRNIHDVPQEAILRFEKQWEEMTQEEVDVMINLPSELRIPTR